MSSIRSAGGTASQRELLLELNAMASRGDCRKFDHPVKRGEFMYGCKLGEAKD